jgi:hypothetical protein
MLSESEKALHIKIKYNLDNKDKLLKIFEEKVLHIADKLNSGEMDFDEWVIWFNKLPPIIIDGHKYYFSVWEYLDNSTPEEYVIIHYGDPNYVGLTFTDLEDEMKEIMVNSKHTITSDVNKYSYVKSSIGGTNGLVYYWVDPLSIQSVKKQNVNTRWIDKTGRKGYVSIGIDLEDLSQTFAYKYYQHIRPVTLVITSIMTLAIAIVINNLNAINNSKLRAFLFLIVSNMFLLIFMNSYESESTPENELLKKRRITSSILNFSFLSGVNIYILKSLFENKKQYFKETAFIFGVAIILILMTTYSYMTPNSLENIITSRISAQLTFNLAVILNALILINFMFYTLSLKNIIKL